jgi:hypothetical protein
MSTTSALSPRVLQYLEDIRGAPCRFERFLSSADFSRMKEFAKGFGGIRILLPEGDCALELNVFGVLTLKPRFAVIYTASSSVVGVRDEEYSSRVRDFIEGIQKWCYPGKDPAWCAAVVIQAIYDSVTARVEAAIASSSKE